jgi:hypothetical protein
MPVASPVVVPMLWAGKLVQNVSTTPGGVQCFQHKGGAERHGEERQHGEEVQPINRSQGADRMNEEAEADSRAQKAGIDAIAAVQERGRDHDGGA